MTASLLAEAAVESSLERCRSPASGRTQLWSKCTLSHESEKAMKFGRQMFKDICVACGILDSVQDLNVLHFRDCLITVTVRKDESGQYRDKNEVRSVLPIPKWDVSPLKPVKTAAQALKEASSTAKAFDPVKQNMNDEIPF